MIEKLKEKKKKKKPQTFEDVSLEDRRVKLKRPVTILNHMLVKVQLAIAKCSIAETKQKKKSKSEPKNEANCADKHQS